MRIGTLRLEKMGNNRKNPYKQNSDSQGPSLKNRSIEIIQERPRITFGLLKK